MDASHPSGGTTIQLKLVSSLSGRVYLGDLGPFYGVSVVVFNWWVLTKEDTNLISYWDEEGSDDFFDDCGDCDDYHGSRGDKGGYPNKIIFSRFRTKIYS